MPKLERYIPVGSRRLRCGYTTGTCAAAATRAAAEFLLNGAAPAMVSVETPAGVIVPIDIEEASHGDGWARCAVRKDGGDDPDITDGILVYARVALVEGPAVAIDGGEGVGRVTRPGLDQPVGSAAINHVPRQMIDAQAREVAKLAGYEGGFDIIISMPDGARLASKTFNPRLGIVGGISVLGTSGIVKPMSEEALIASIELELSTRYAAGIRDLVITPGNYGYDYANDALGLDMERDVSCSNYLGTTIDRAVGMGFGSLLVVGHAGKLVKVAAGVMNTHSRVADARRETMAAHAALSGASHNAIRSLMESTTTDEDIDILISEGILDEVMESIMERINFQLNHRVGDGPMIEAVMFSKVHGLLGTTPGADELIARNKMSTADRPVPAEENERGKP